MCYKNSEYMHPVQKAESQKTDAQKAETQKAENILTTT